MKNVKVSILATYYNIAEYVDQGIESILNQKCDFEYEIIVGDDGSNDGTLEKLQAWRDKYPDKISIFVMDRDPNVKYIGPVRASRNRLNLLQYVNGQYFMYFDGDDYYIDEHKLQKQVDILDKHPEYTACGHKIVRHNEKTEEKVLIPNTNRPCHKSDSKYWKTDYLHTDTLLFRTKDIQKLDMDVLKDVFNDNRITFAMLKDGSVYYIPDAMCVYRWTGTGIYTESDEYIKNLREIISFETELRVNPKLKRESMIRHYLHLKFFIDYKSAIALDDCLLDRWKEVLENNHFELVMDCYNVIRGAEASDRLSKCAKRAKAYYYTNMLTFSSVFCRLSLKDE